MGFNSPIRFSFSTLRDRLIILVALAVIPSLLLTLHTASEQRRLAAAEGKARALGIAQRVASDHEKLTEGARQLLVGLSELPQVKNHDTASCNNILINVLEKFPTYTGILAAKPNGEVFCSSPALPGSLTISDRPSFQKAIQTKTFVVSEYMIGRLSGKPVITFSYPSLEDWKVKAYVAAAMDLSWLNRLISGTPLPKDSVIAVIDRSGTLLARYPDPSHWVGKNFAQTPLFKQILETTEGSTEVDGFDGVRRLYAFTSMEGSDPPGLYVTVGIPKETVFAQANLVLSRNMTGIGAVAILAFIAAWVGGDLFVVRRVHSLVAVAKKIAAGDFGARTPEYQGKGELDDLAHSFNEMSESIERLIHERDRAELALRENEELYRAVVENVADGIVINVGLERRLVNDAFLKIHGLQKPDEVIGKPCDYFVLDEDKKIVTDRTLARQRGDEAPSIYEYRIVRPNGDIRTIETSAKAITYKGNAAALAVLRDVTDQRRAQQDLMERTRQLEAANRELEAFSYSVSHDLRAPLRSIDGFSQALLEDYSDKLDDYGKDCLQRVRAASQRMALLIDDLLNLSRVTRTEMRRETVNLSLMTRQIANELQKSQPDRSANFAIASEVTVNGDARLLRIVMENFLNNAWKFTSKRAQTTIEFGVQENGVKKIYFVKDNGAGFDMAYASKLFGAFQRLHTPTEFPGTGIGLATVQRIIHRHGGQVWAEGKVEEGANFYFTL